MNHIRKNTCSISDAWTYNGMRVVWLENDLVKIGILVDRGSDIFEFRYKPKDLNFLLRLPKDIHNPVKVVSQMRNTPSQMEDYYYGGWQECLPNSAPFNYRGASLGQHGEVWMNPWSYSLGDRGPDKVSVTLWTSPLRIPLTIEKTLVLKNDSASLHISEQLTNDSDTDLDIMWGHHIAFGLPFLKEGARIDTNANKFIAEPNMPTHRRFKPGIESVWPKATNVDGRLDMADQIPKDTDAPYSDLAYLSGFGDEGYYALKNEDQNLGFAVRWDASLFQHLWYWQERYATQDAPWWGSAYAVGLEPWSTPYQSDPEKALAEGELLKISAGQTIKTYLNATPFEGEFRI